MLRAAVVHSGPLAPVRNSHSESQCLYRTAYTLLAAKNLLEVVHHGAKEQGDSGKRRTDEPGEDDGFALRLVGRHGPVVRYLPPELRGALLGRPPRPLERLRAARPRTPRRSDRQGFRVRGPGGTSRRREGRRRPDRHRRRDRDPRGDEPLPGGEGEDLRVPRADLPGPPPRAELPGGGQGRPRFRDAEGRHPRGPGPEEGADPRAETRQGAGRVTRPLTYSLSLFRFEVFHMSSSNAEYLLRNHAKAARADARKEAR